MLKDEAFDLIRDLPLLETRPEHLLKVMEVGTVSTNVFLRRVHNFALDMGWLPWPLIPKKHWPRITFREKQCGYPERFAQAALGHHSKAVHRAYSRKAKVRLPSLQNCCGRCWKTCMSTTYPSSLHDTMGRRRS